MRKILFAITQTLILIGSIPLYFYVKKTNDQKMLMKFIQFLAKSGNFVAKNKVEVIGKENLVEGASLVVSNHDSIFDIYNIIYAMNRPLGFVAKKELSSIPIMSKWMLLANTEFFDRENLKKQIKSINGAAKTVKKGYSMGIFPEGTRSEEDMKFKTGSFKISQKAKAPIQIMTMVNTAALYEGNDKKMHGAKTYVIISKPMLYEEYGEKPLSQVAEEVQSIVISTKKEYMKKIK